MALNRIFICLFFFFFLCRILSCIQAGACNIRSYWQTHGSSVRGLVWMRRTYSGKVVTTWGHFVTGDKPSASCCRLPPQLVLSRFKKQTFACRNWKDTTTTLFLLHTQTEREYNTFKQLIVHHYHALFYIKPSVYEGKKKKHECPAFV